MTSYSNTPDIITSTGRLFHFFEPTADQICIEDIAHGLSHKCRFAGHTVEFYSVAEHSLRVADCLPREHKLWGLLHDAAEAYTTDMPRPLKRELPEYRVVENRIQEEIIRCFGLPWPEPPIVKFIDNKLLATEGRDLCNGNWEVWKLPYKPFSDTIRPCTDLKRVKHIFIETFYALSSGEMQLNITGMLEW